MNLHREEKREEGDRSDQEEKRGVKRRETDPASISSLSVLHNPENTERITELGRGEKWEGGDRGDLGEKKESQKGERAIKPVITLLNKNGY